MVELQMQTAAVSCHTNSRNETANSLYKRHWFAISLHHSRRCHHARHLCPILQVATKSAASLIRLQSTSRYSFTSIYVYIYLPIAHHCLRIWLLVSTRVWQMVTAKVSATTEMCNICNRKTGCHSHAYLWTHIQYIYSYHTYVCIYCVCVCALSAWLAKLLWILHAEWFCCN